MLKHNQLSLQELQLNKLDLEIAKTKAYISKPAFRKLPKSLRNLHYEGLDKLMIQRVNLERSIEVRGFVVSKKES